jgi:hypothetical protein
MPRPIGILTPAVPLDLVRPGPSPPGLPLGGNRLDAPMDWMFSSSNPTEFRRAVIRAVYGVLAESEVHLSTPDAIELVSRLSETYMTRHGEGVVDLASIRSLVNTVLSSGSRLEDSSHVKTTAEFVAEKSQASSLRLHRLLAENDPGRLFEVDQMLSSASASFTGVERLTKSLDSQLGRDPPKLLAVISPPIVTPQHVVLVGSVQGDNPSVSWGLSLGNPYSYSVLPLERYYELGVARTFVLSSERHSVVVGLELTWGSIVKGKQYMASLTAREGFGGSTFDTRVFVADLE